MAGLRTGERAAFAVLSLLTALAGIAHYAHWAPLLAFGLATAALAGLAWIVSLATEQLGERTGPAATGLLQSTLGNLPELFVVLFALHAGEVVVAQTAIIGSLFANGLLVLGIVLIAGSSTSPDRVMRFHPKLTNDTTTLLLVALFTIVLVGLSLSAGDPASRHVKTISAVGAVLLLLVYLTWVIPYLRADRSPGHGAPRLALSATLVLLATAGGGSAFVSDWFIAALAPAIRQLGITQAFTGIVIVAIAGNAVENVAGIALAVKQRSDLAISVVVNSVAQIAAFLFPLLVLISLAFRHSLTFSLAPIYIGALFVSALAIWQATADGEGHVFEGAALVSLYVILATIALYE
jgi:Ca2+:H+ antiporter